MLKRSFDILICSLAIIPVTVILLLIAVLVRLFDGTPVYFRQKRPGLHSKPFKLIKFRTMSESYDDTGKPLADSKRLTKLGKILRKTSSDELPSLLNVLKGDMSLVGPRPLLMEYLPLYTSEQARRHEVKPGITGWAQINGRNTIDWDEKFRLDVWYVDHQSFWLDLKIILLTVVKVFRSEGITFSGHATMKRFCGRSK